MNLLLAIKEFLQEAKIVGTYKGTMDISSLEQYAEEVYQGNYKNLQSMILPTLALDKFGSLTYKLDKIKEIKENEE